MSFKTPDWVKHAVFYQIFPDRFRRSDRLQHPPSVTFKAWGSDPAEQGYHGGDLYGIAEKLDYLHNLGVTALYLNPIFASAANHRYHTFDYYQVDPLLGGNTALRHLIDEVHAREMFIVLDGVFNHASRGFWQFHHILEEGGNSPYIDWFIIHDWPLRPYSSGPDAPFNYAAWWNLPALPKFNFSNPDVQQYFLDVARYWINFGIDGWRLDVPAEIEVPGFWEQFREAVKGLNPEAYIVGEIWSVAEEWLTGDRFDATMNYIFAWSSISFFGAETIRPSYALSQFPVDPLDAGHFAKIVNDMHARRSWEVNLAQLNLLDSHDTARMLHIVQDDVTALQLCVLFQMTMPGAPCIYYGSEMGLSGGKDPASRESYPWGDKPPHDLRNFYRRATQMRHTYPVLRTGDFRILVAEKKIFAFKRVLNATTAIVIFNTGQVEALVQLDDATETFRAVWGESQVNRDGQVAIPARSAAVLISC